MYCCEWNILSFSHQSSLTAVITVSIPVCSSMKGLVLDHWEPGASANFFLKIAPAPGTQHPKWWEGSFPSTVVFSWPYHFMNGVISFYTFCTLDQISNPNFIILWLLTNFLKSLVRFWQHDFRSQLWKSSNLKEKVGFIKFETCQIELCLVKYVNQKI